MQRIVLFASISLNIILLATGAYFAVNFSNRMSLGAERQLTQQQLLSTRQADTVFLGDSITAGGLWSELFDKTAIANRGVNGDTIQDVLERLDSVVALRPRRLLLMIGMNNLIKGISHDDTRNNYETLFERLAQELPDTEILVQSVLPANDHSIADVNDQVPALNATLVQLCEDYGWTYLNLHPEFAGADGQLREELSNDGIHLLGAGYELWRTLVLEQVNAPLN